MDQLAYRRAADITAAVRARELSVVEIAEAFLDRIDRVDPAIHAFVTVDPDQVREQARSLDERREGALLGVPTAIKDLTPTAGLRTTFGSLRFKDHVPTEDALIVRRLREAGALIIGKTNTPEHGVGGHTFNQVAGTTLNPWDPTRSAGGSSGSAAALAAGLCTLAEGSDTGGSLRMPASFCGVVGYRTSIGLVPDVPGELAWDTLSVPGPMGRTIDDVAAMLDVVAGPDPRSPLSLAWSIDELRRRRFADPVRVGWSVAAEVLPVAPEVERAVEDAARALEEAGCAVEEAGPDLSGLEEAVQTMRGARAAAAFGSYLDGGPEPHPGLAADVRRGRTTTGPAVVEAELARGRVYARTVPFWETHDVLVLPSTPIAAFPASEVAPMEVAGRRLEIYSEWFQLTHAVTLMGWPALAVPSTPTAEGLPLGVQLIAQQGNEWALLELARRYESVVGWETRFPPRPP